MKGRVLFVRSTPNDIDINTYNVQQVGLGKAFCDLGYSFDYITYKKDNPRNKIVFYEKADCKAVCYELPRFRFLRWGINWSICNKDFLDKYDLIISLEYYQLETYLLSKKSNKVVLYNGPYYNMFMPKWFSLLYDKFIGPKLNKQIKYKFVKSILSEKFLAQKGYTGLYNIGVGLDTSRFDNENEIKPSTQQLIDFMKANKCILYVGALSDRKNYPFLLEVYKKAKERIPELKFVMIGKSVVSAMAKLMGKKNESYARQYYDKLPQHVKEGIYHIERIENPQLKFIYPLATAFLLPSKLEIFGMVLLEAMYLRTPVITSYNGGSATLIEGRNTGQIIKEFDVEKWVRAIEKYMSNPQYTREVTNNAEKLIRDEYNWSVLAKKFLSISGVKL